MRVWPWGFCAFLLISASEQTAYSAPEREGFTGDLGIGVSLTSVNSKVDTIQTCLPGVVCSSSSEPRTDTRFGLAPISVSLGGFFNPTVALLFRAAGTSYFVDGDQWLHGFYGPVIEVWPHDRFYFGGGVGLALFGPNPLTNSNADPSTGFAIDLRAGVALVNATHHDATISVEVIPGFYGDDTVVGYALVGAWKWY